MRAMDVSKCVYSSYLHGIKVKIIVAMKDQTACCVYLSTGVPVYKSNL